MDFYSARLLYIVLVNDQRPRKRNHYDESILMFRARDATHAFERALELGKSHEVVYKNHRDRDVRWALVEVSELRRVGRKVDGEEVSSAMFHETSREPIPFDRTFRPERSNPRPAGWASD